MNVIRQDGSLINGKSTLGRDLYPVVDQGFARLRIKYSTAKRGGEHEVMSQIEACVRGCENLGFCCSEPKYWGKRSCAVAVMLGLTVEVALDRLDSDMPGAAREIPARPDRWGETELLTYRG